MSEMIKTFDNVYLSNRTNYVDWTNSHAVPVPAETVRINATVIEIAGSVPSLRFELQGSYDGQVWSTAGLGSAVMTMGSAPGVSQSTAAVAVSYPFVRLHGVVTGTSAQVLFDAELVFSHQVN